MSRNLVSEMVIDVAKKEILPRFNNLKDSDISEKSPGDLVSVADIEAEKALTSALQKQFPTAVIGGEETIAHQPDLLARIISADQAFLIDPVDGTNNFIKGDSRFAVMLTELKQGVVVAAWIYLPVSEKMAFAEQGRGAWLGGKKVSVKVKSLAPEGMVAAAHLKRFPDHLRLLARQNLKHFKENRPAFCAGHDYLMLLEGAKDFSIYYRTLPWDHLPGGFIFAEAGGYVRTLYDQKHYTIHEQSRGLLSAASKDQWEMIRKTVFSEHFENLYDFSTFLT